MIAPTDPVPPLPTLEHLQHVQVVDAKWRHLLSEWDEAFGRIVIRRPGMPPQFRPDRKPSMLVPVESARHRGGLIVEPVRS